MAWRVANGRTFERDGAENSGPPQTTEHDTRGAGEKSSCHAANHFYSGIGNKGDAAGNICDALGISADYLLRGQVVESDVRLLNQTVSSLTSCQYRHLENIIDNFIAAIQEGKEV